MKRLVLLLGGNLGDRLHLLQQAENYLEEICEIIEKSRIYESSAWGDNSEGNYLNRAIIIETDMDPKEVLRHTQEIENLLERERIRKWGNRTMDIDILYVEEEIIDTPSLVVPHPFIQERRFVLIPLTELMPEFKHPILGKTNAQLLEDCSDEGEVREFKV